MEKEITKPKKSASAIIMYILMGIAIIFTTACFALFYTGVYENSIVLWAGIIAFLVLYQFSLRLVFGEVNKHFNIRYNQLWFKELPFEKRLYKLIRVKKWKNKVPTFNPELFVIEDYTYEELANTMAKVEVDHWTNVIISISTLLFIIPWDRAYFFITIAILAILFDCVFISIQRYNRPRVVKAIAR